MRCAREKLDGIVRELHGNDDLSPARRERGARDEMGVVEGWKRCRLETGGQRRKGRDRPRRPVRYFAMHLPQC